MSCPDWLQATKRERKLRECYNTAIIAASVVVGVVVVIHKRVKGKREQERMWVWSVSVSNKARRESRKSVPLRSWDSVAGRWLPSRLLLVACHFTLLVNLPTRQFRIPCLNFNTDPDISDLMFEFLVFFLLLFILTSYSGCVSYTLPVLSTSSFWLKVWRNNHYHDPVWRTHIATLFCIRGSFLSPNNNMHKPRMSTRGPPNKLCLCIASQP